MLLTSDFETTTNPNDCRVWAWGVCEIGNVTFFQYGKTIDELMDFCNTTDCHTLYFHNLRFDGTFILVWLFENGFTHVLDKRDLESKTFSTLISDKGQFYTMTIMFYKKGKTVRKVTIYDSLKILPFSVAEIAKGFNLPIHKLEIDYHKPRPIGYEMTGEEVDYLHNDCAIVAQALDTLFSQSLKQMTQGSNALHDYKKTVTEKCFTRWFPTPSYDADVRQSYKGGFTYLNPIYADKDIGKGIVLDVNSLYPSVMRNRLMPYGDGLFFQGEYESDDLYPLYVQMLKCNFELKPHHIPTIQLKNNLSFIPTQYLTSSNGEDVALCLTSVDLELFLKQYDVYNIEYISGWKFKATMGLFNEYIDKWTTVKIQSKKDGNKAMYTLAKLMLNALYGKFALNPNVQSKIPIYNDGVIDYKLGEKETRDPIYIPVGTFITSWARFTTITAAQKLYDRFIYADTDSLHLLGEELPQDIEIDDAELGKWKHENTFNRARFLRQKSYIEEIEITEEEYNKLKSKETPNIYKRNKKFYHLEITCAGLPDSCYKHVTWKNFHPGTSFPGKLQMSSVKGGIILKDIDFTIKR
jgi:hypothetical protein